MHLLSHPQEKPAGAPEGSAPEAGVAYGWVADIIITVACHDLSSYLSRMIVR